MSIVFHNHRSTPFKDKLFRNSQHIKNFRQKVIENRFYDSKDILYDEIINHSLKTKTCYYHINLNYLFIEPIPCNNHYYRLTKQGLLFYDNIKPTEPILPDKEEINYLGNKLKDYFEHEGLHVSFNEATLRVLWNEKMLLPDKLMGYTLPDKVSGKILPEWPSYFSYPDSSNYIKTNDFSCIL